MIFLYYPLYHPKRKLATGISYFFQIAAEWTEIIYDLYRIFEKSIDRI